MKVPVYEMPEVHQAPLADAGLSVDTSGAFGQQAVPAVDHAIGVYQHSKQQADAAATADAETQLQSSVNAALWDKDNGLMLKRGDQVFPPDSKQDLGQQTFASLAKKRADIVQGLSNDNQRSMFILRSNGMLEQSQRQIEQHVGQQRLLAQEASSQGIQATSLDALANSYADPVARARLMAQPEGPIAALALSPEDRDAKLAAWRQRATATVLSQYIASKDYQGAQDYFSQAKDQLGPESAQFEQVIGTLTEKEQGRQTALQIIQNSRQQNGFIDDARAVRAFEQLPASKLNEHTEQAFHQFLGLEKASEANQKSTVFAGAFSDFLQNHSLADVAPRREAWLKANDPEQWSRLEQLAASWQRKDDPASPQRTANFIDLMTRMERNPLAYKGMDPAQFTAIAAPALSEADYKRAGEKFAAIQKVPDVKMTGQAATTVTELFQHAFGEPKVNAGAWTPAHQELWRNVHDYVESQANVYVRGHDGKQPDDEHWQKWANDQLARGSVVGAGRLYGDANDVTRVEAEHNPRYAGKPFVEDVPDAFRTKMIQISRLQKKPKPSDDVIRAMYARRKQLEGDNAGP